MPKLLNCNVHTHALLNASTSVVVAFPRPLTVLRRPPEACSVSPNGNALEIIGSGGASSFISVILKV